MKILKTYKLFEAKKITELDYSNQGLTSLPELPESLVALFCFNNKLSELPELPESLEILECYNNQLSELPELPDSLKELYCDHNRLRSLPELPDSLKRLDCENNRLPYKDLEGYWKYQEENDTEIWRNHLKKKEIKKFKI